MTRIVCLSDTHNRQSFPIPEGDVLLHCGDMTSMGTEAQLVRARQWLASLPFNDVVVIGGNHDLELEKWGYERCRDFFAAYDIRYLEGTWTHVVGGHKVWGGPWIPPIWGAWEREEEDMMDLWQLIPDNTDIVMTHAPAYGTLDRVLRGGFSVGCEALRERLDIVRPKLHVHGHIHEAAGRAIMQWGTTINAAICSYPNHDTLNPVQVIDL